MAQPAPSGKSPATWGVVTVLLTVAIAGALWVGDVDDLVPGGVECGDGGAQRHRLARPDVPRDHSQR